MKRESHRLDVQTHIRHRLRPDAIHVPFVAARPIGLQKRIPITMPVVPVVFERDTDLFAAGVVVSTLVAIVLKVLGWA